MLEKNQTVTQFSSESYHARIMLNNMRPLDDDISSIIRKNLLSSIEQHRDAHLIIMHAPAGYGKTTLMVQYYQQLQQEKRFCHWLTLDNSIDDPVQLLAYISVSAQSHQQIDEDVIKSALNGFHGLDKNEALNLVVNILSEFTESLYIFLDDYHLITAEPCQQIIEKLIKLTVGNSHFILASRERPITLTSRLQISRSYFELTTTDLMLSKAEITEFINLSANNDITPELIDLLLIKTEGWVAAIQYAKTWLDKDRAADITKFLDLSTDFSIFIMTEIFNELPEKIQNVILTISILQRFNGDVINTICHINDGWEIIEKLTQYDLAISVDINNKTYRFNALIKDFLLDKLNKTKQINKYDLHRQAAQWYCNQGDYYEALQQALACKNVDVIAAIIEQGGGWHFVLDGRISTLTTILKHLPINIIQRYPRTYLGYIMLEAKLGKVNQAIEKYNDFKKKSVEFTVLNNKALPASFTAEAKIVNFFLNAIADRPQSNEYINEMELALKKVSSKDHFLQANLLNYLSFGYFDNYQFDQASNAAESAIFHYRSLGSIYGENYLYFHLGKICLAQGRLRDAEHFYEEGFQLAVQHFGKESNIAAIAAAHLAETCYEKNQVEQAQTYLDISFPQIEQSEAWFDVYISAYITAANIAYMNNDISNAMAVFSKASFVGKQRSISRLRIFSMACRVRILTHAGKLKKVRRIIKCLGLLDVENNPLKLENISERVSEEVQITLAYYFINTDEILRAINIIKPILLNAKQNNCRRSLVSITLLLALSYFKLNNNKQALIHLNEALSHAVFEGIKRPFLDYGKDLHALYNLALNDPTLFSINRLKRSFLKQLITIVNGNSKQRHSTGQLTPREQEIVKHISDGQSNKEIARSCNCSENTVKFHLKNIFAKYNVNSRRALAQKAWNSD